MNKLRQSGGAQWEEHCAHGQRAGGKPSNATGCPVVRIKKRQENKWQWGQFKCEKLHLNPSAAAAIHTVDDAFSETVVRVQGQNDLGNCLHTLIASRHRVRP